jgi:hypothetical protein
MEPVPTETILALIVTVAAGVSMARVGLGKGALARRIHNERCASCGNRLRGNSCPRCRRR